MRTRFVPYKLGSVSCRSIAQELNIKRIRTHDTRFVPRHDDVLLNWGCGSSPFINDKGTWLNHPNNVSKAANKITTLTILKDADVPTLQFTRNVAEAEEWVTETDTIVYCRKQIHGEGGAGIVIAKNIEELVQAPLYTKGVTGYDEFRLHVFNGRVFDLAQKRKRQTDADPTRFNPLIRNFDNGWVFVRNDPRTSVSDSCREVAVAGVQALGLDFGAVDMLVNPTDSTSLILEINTAPGITGTTLEKYVEQFKSYIS